MKICVDDVTYYVEVEGTGEPVFLLHGFTGNSATWNHLRSVLTDSFQVVAVDLLGHGKTDKPADPRRYEMNRAGNDLVEIMDQLNIEKAHVLGYSMGGRLALGMTMMHPEKIKSLILESASPGLKTEEERTDRAKNDEALADRILVKGLEEFVSYWEDIPLFESQKKLPQEIRFNIREQRLRNDPKGLANSLRGFGTGRQPSWWQELSGLKIPVLLLSGGLDQKFCKIAEEMSRLLPLAHRMEFSKAGHALHVEEPDKFGTIVKEFLLDQEQ